MKLIIEKLHAAAFYLTKHPESTAKQVGDFVGVSDRTIIRWSKTAEWNEALDNLGFKGDRGWRREATRDAERDSGDLIALGKQTYLNYREQGITTGKATRMTARVLNCSEKRIYEWRRKFGWDTQGDTQ